MPAQIRRSVLWAVSYRLDGFPRSCSAGVTILESSNHQPEWYTLIDLKGFKVYYGFASRSYDVTIDVGLTTNAVLCGLQDGRTYYLAVTAYGYLWQPEPSLH